MCKEFEKVVSQSGVLEQRPPIRKSTNQNISKPICAFIFLFFLVLFFFLAVAEVVESAFMIVEKVDRDGETPLRAPSDKLVPADDALATAIPAHAHGAPEVLRDATVPAGLANRAVDGVDVFPALIGRDLGQVRRRERAADGGGAPRVGVRGREGGQGAGEERDG